MKNENMENIMDKLLNCSEYLADNADLVRDQIKSFKHDKANPEIIAESITEYVNILNQSFEKFSKAYDEACELTNFVPNWK